MSTLKTLTNVEPPTIIVGSDTCGNGHKWTAKSTRWRWRDRTSRKDGHGWAGWERDCLICKRVSKGRSGSGLRSQSWVPGGTND